MSRVLYALLLVSVASFAFCPTAAFAAKVQTCTQGGSSNPCPTDPPNSGGTITEKPKGHVDNENYNPDANSDTCTSPNPNICP